MNDHMQANTVARTSCDGCESLFDKTHEDVARCASGEVNKVQPIVPRHRRALMPAAHAAAPGGPCGPERRLYLKAYWR